LDRLDLYFFLSLADRDAGTYQVLQPSCDAPMFEKIVIPPSLASQVTINNPSHRHKKEMLLEG
jgi:hypothetical protein